MCFLAIDRTEIGDRASLPDFLDLDVYSNLDYMPFDLKCAMMYSVRVRNRYCKVFRYIIACLKEGYTLTANVLDCRIFYSNKIEDAMIFLLAGKGFMYALKYLIYKVKELLLRDGFRQSKVRLTFLPKCLNNTCYNLI
jgi:hypothetical protein